MKIVSVGCSFTSGVGVLANETYTYQLSKLINSDFHNWGEAGHSNQYIFRKTIELLKNWDKNDILIIQWTNSNRDEIVTNEGYLFYPPFSYWCSLSFLYGKDPIPDLQKIGISDKDKFEKEIVEKNQSKVIEYSENFYNPEYQSTISFCFQYALYGLLKHLNIKFIMFYGWEFEYYKKEIFSLTDTNFIKEKFGVFVGTEYGEHPDASGHLKWAEFLYKKIIELNYINLI